ncbi:MAG TPA: hypothetical protein VFQ66_04115 [Candidatus Limnocylindria bacterium]|nr:hypothetical protein [Candidatus Limnocylindria bacterium]
MDDPRLVALGLVPPPPGQEQAPETETLAAAPEAPPVTPDWQPAEQSQYLPGANPFSEAANTIPQYPDPFTTPLPPATPPPPAAPPQPAVPSIFNSPNSPFSFAPSATSSAAPAAPEYTTAPEYTPATTHAREIAPSPFTSANSPFGFAAAPTTFTPAAPVAAPTTKEGKKAALKAIEEAKKAAKIAEENAEKAAKIAEEDAKRNAKLAAAQAKIDEREAKIAEREAKKAAEREAKNAKRTKLLAPEVPPTAPFVATPYVPPAPAPAPKPFTPTAAAIPARPQRTQPYVELMAAIGKHPAVIRKDVQYGYFGRARLELSPMGFALVGKRTGTAYTWNEVKDIRASRGRLEIKTEADRERVVKTKESTTIQPYVEKLTRALVISIDGATEPGFAPYIAKVMQDMKAQTFNYHATSWLEYENALERVRGEFAEHDDPFVPAVAGALFAFIFIAGLFILPEIVNLASDIKPPAGAFVVQPRYGWFDIRSFVMAIGLSALLTRLVLRLGLGSSALSWARGSVRGWHTSGPLPLRIASRELARLLLGTSFAAAALFLGFAAFAPTVASTLVIDSVGLREVVPLPLIGVDKKWGEVSDVQKSEGPGRLEGFGVTVFFRDGRWVTTVDHDLSGGTDGQLYQRATSWWKTATE